MIFAVTLLDTLPVPFWGLLAAGVWLSTLSYRMLRLERLAKSNPYAFFAAKKPYLPELEPATFDGFPDPEPYYPEEL